MPLRKFTPELLTVIRYWLRDGKKPWFIRRELKKQDLTISDAYLSKLRNAENRRVPHARRGLRRSGRSRKLNSGQLANLKRQVSRPNPPTQRALAKIFGVSKHCIQNAIKFLGLRLVKKPKCHALSSLSLSFGAKSTLAYLNNRGIRYVTPDEWMPSSPDCAPCDFFLWGYLKSQLNKRKPTTIAGLQRAIADELRKIPQEMIKRALRAWPKRCKQVYDARGGHIEKFRA
jgi:hypothetical protein